MIYEGVVYHPDRSPHNIHWYTIHRFYTYDTYENSFFQFCYYLFKWFGGKHIFDRSYKNVQVYLAEFNFRYIYICQVTSVYERLIYILLDRYFYITTFIYTGIMLYLRDRIQLRTKIILYDSINSIVNIGTIYMSIYYDYVKGRLGAYECSYNALGLMNTLYVIIYINFIMVIFNTNDIMIII